MIQCSSHLYTQRSHRHCYPCHKSSIYCPKLSSKIKHHMRLNNLKKKCIQLQHALNAAHLLSKRLNNVNLRLVTFPLYPFLLFSFVEFEKLNRYYIVFSSDSFIAFFSTWKPLHAKSIF